MGASTYIGWRDVLPFGSEYWQHLDVLSGYYNPWTYSNPGTNGLALMTNSYSSYGNMSTELYYTSNVLDTFGQVSKDGNGNIIRSQSKPFEHKLTYPDGRTFDLHNAGDISYSANGRWMYLNVQTVGQLRINTSDFSVFSFGSGVTPSYAFFTALSNSGNTAVTDSYDQGLKLYDLTQCEGEKSDYGSRNCASRDLTQEVREAIIKTLPDPSKFSWWAPSEIKFSTESQIRLFVRYGYDGQDKTAFFNLETDAGQTATRYLALGDSFSSGEGAGNYYEATNFWADENNYNLCHQSRVAYSELLNKYLSPDFYDSVACSGAVMQDVVYNADDATYVQYGPPQTKSPDNVGSLIEYTKRTNRPGYIPQLSLIQANSPTISTISIGGNNIGFKDIIIACATQAACYSTEAERRSLASLIDQRISELASTYKTVKENLSGSNPKLYVIGYPRLFNADNLCGDFMSGQERQFANALVDYLNAAIKIAADQAGVRYVNTGDAFYDYETEEDHRLCGNSFPAANGILADVKNASDTQHLVDYLRSSYHPNALGNALLAKRIRQLTNDFNLAMPSVVSRSSVPDNALYRNLVGSDRTDEENDVTSILDGGTTAVLTYSNFIGLNLNLGSMALPVLTGHVTVQLHSDPITLGTLPVGSDGVISGSFAIPEGIQPGMHEVHVLYTDIAGQNHDLIKHVYIIASMNDFDGDGTPNSQEQCAIGGTMGIDLDKDGLDDACDTNVSETAAATNTTTNTSSDGSSKNAGNTGSMSSPLVNSPRNLTDSDTLTINSSLTLGASGVVDTTDMSAVTQQAPQNKLNYAQHTKQNTIWIYIITFILVLLSLLLIFRTYRRRKQL